MFWYVFLGFFGAFGVLCALWVVFGLFLPGSSACHITLRCPAKREIAMLRRLCWLREMGMLRAHITVVSSSLSKRQQHMITQKYPYIEFAPNTE